MPIYWVVLGKIISPPPPPLSQSKQMFEGEGACWSRPCRKLLHDEIYQMLILIYSNNEKLNYCLRGKEQCKPRCPNANFINI